MFSDNIMYNFEHEYIFYLHFCTLRPHTPLLKLLYKPSIFYIKRLRIYKGINDPKMNIF